jgi:quinol monooxygenase YgiN
VAVIAIDEMFAISGRRDELARLLERFGSWAGGEPGCRRYMFAATLSDPSRFVLVSEWETQEALEPTIALKTSPTSARPRRPAREAKRVDV